MTQNKIQKHIEIVRSSSPALSSMSEKSCAALYAFLQSHYQTVGISLISTLDDLEQLKQLNPDLVFQGMKYVPGKFHGTKIWISKFLEDNDIAHTGSNYVALRLEQNKELAKQKVLSSGLNSAKYWVAGNYESLKPSLQTMVYPLFVKPLDLGAGQGVDEHSVVHNQQELKAKIQSITAETNHKVLIETYLPGREFSVAVLRQPGASSFTAMPIEMHPAPNSNGDRILSYALKSGELETPVSAVEDRELKEDLSRLAIAVFKVLGARDYGRIDIRLDKQGEPHFLEANLIPSIIRGSGNFPKACLLNRGLDYEEMIQQIVDFGFERTNTVDFEISFASSPETAPIRHT